MSVPYLMGDLDFTRSIDRMIQRDIAGRGVRDERVLSAMRRVPRHLFVRPSDYARAYDDCALPIGNGQTISQPYIVAVMTELLKTRATDKVLEIGTGSGYQAAVLAELVAEVHTFERVASLAEKARKRLAELGYANISFHSGDGTLGLPALAPFDGIVVTAGAERPPEPLIEQLALGRNLVLPIGSRYHQTMAVVTKTREGHTIRELFDCSFVPLIGEHGWPGEASGG
jgi:protein-L-isoaspartate(D-aspartate) O-methyltransferase